MEAVEFLFPLLNLPEKALKYVIQQMEEIEQFSYSLISKPTKDHVIHLGNLRVRRFDLTIRDDIEIDCGSNSSHFFKQESNQIKPNSELPIPGVILVRGDEDSLIRNLKNWSFKQIVTHLTEIYHCNKAELSLHMRNKKSPIEPLYDAFLQLTIGLISIDTRSHEALVLKFLPRTKRCMIISKRQFKQEFLHKILISNFDYLSTVYPLQLNDMLVTNSSQLNMKAKFTEKELNRFLRSWQMGSNPRLKYLELRVLPIPKTQLNKDLIFKGTNGQEATHDDLLQITPYKQQHGEEEPYIPLYFSYFGLNLHRIDGQRATVSLVWMTQVHFALHMAVWDPSFVALT